MAIAFKKAVDAGRDAYEMGLPETSDHASAPSPLTGFLGGMRGACFIGISAAFSFFPK